MAGWWPPSRQSLSQGQAYSLGGSSHGRPHSAPHHIFSPDGHSMSHLCSQRAGYDLGGRAQYPHCHQDLSLSKLLHSGSREEVKEHLPLIFILNIYTLSLFVGVGACHNAHVKGRGRLARASSVLPPCGSGDQTWVVGHGGKYPYSLSHLSSPSVFKIIQTASRQIESPTSCPFRSPLPCAEAKVRGCSASLRALVLEAATSG